MHLRGEADRSDLSRRGLVHGALDRPPPQLRVGLGPAVPRRRYRIASRALAAHGPVQTNAQRLDLAGSEVDGEDCGHSRMSSTATGPAMSIRWSPGRRPAATMGPAMPWPDTATGPASRWPEGPTSHSW